VRYGLSGSLGSCSWRAGCKIAKVGASPPLPLGKSTAFRTSTASRIRLEGVAHTQKVVGVTLMGETAHCGSVLVAVDGLPLPTEYLVRLKSLKWQAMAVRGEMSEEAEDAAGATLEGLRRLGSPVDGAAAPALHPPLGRVRVSELPEEGGLAILSERCRSVGLEELFLTALKINRT
jgi:hypothetical protein